MSAETTSPTGARWSRPARAARLAWALAGTALLLVAAAALLALARAEGWLGSPPPGRVPAEARDWLLAAVCAPLGARIAAHSPRNSCGWLVLGVGLCGATTVAGAAVASAPTDWLRLWVWWPSYGLLVLVALLFPTGAPPGRRWWPVVAALSGVVVVGTAGLISLTGRAPGLLGGDAQVAPGWDSVAVLGATGALLLGAAVAVLALLVRIRRTPPTRRGPLLWATGNAVLLLAAFLLDTVEGVPVIGLLGVLAMPAAAAVGVLRYGLYEIDTLIHRSLAYGLLSLTVLAVYAVTVGLVARVVPPDAAAAVAVVVVGLLPLHEYVRSLLRLAVYGRGARPDQLVGLLNRRIGAAQLPEQVLAGAVTAIGEGMRVPFVQIRLTGREQPEATFGQLRPWSVTTLPLAYQGRAIGELAVQPRGADETWSRRERRLLLGLVAQLGPSAASVRLTRQLQAARERLVHTREEELRRLQQDLHDGVGAALSGARMLTAAARNLVGEPAARTLLDQLAADLGNAAGELRNIIDDLRPPALDRGLRPALEAAVRRHRRADLAVDLDAPDDLAALPAAVEVATYRLVDEALTNVVKHAAAHRARVTVTRDPGHLSIEVVDDGAGPGPGPGRCDGIGLASMRQRCQELGGDFVVTGADPGTRIHAHLPITTG
ncbi:hypothetical protein AWW66_17250 [Micromonospora rosaria]|uniref:histidine kinase n=1 Tax=Micromonospora rosaria TaxID=47874 RepID=A0A136PQP2_9ACTN|nr:histidine kinase [Micromonospora rosaria]KXK60750.1 hypothetical protein AWW66_17250 [Micromonospora rosaria]